MSNCAECPFAGKRIVPSEIRPGAPIVVIGEAPGEHEEKYGKPFVGTTGQLQDRIQKRAGLSREDCSFLNVLQCRPPGNIIKTAAAQRAISLCTPRLLSELQGLRNKKILVPVGNTSLHALGIDAPISAARGAIWSTSYGLAVPTWHPGYVARDWVEFDTSVRDWKKIRRYATGMQVPQPAEKFFTFPTVLEVEEFRMRVDRETANGKRLELAIDIETYHAKATETPLKCICFAHSASEAFVVPMITEAGNWAWKTEEEELRIIQAIGGILENSNVLKIFQYGIFDISVLINHGFEVVGPVFDIILAHYLIYQPAAHDLAFIVSTFSDYPAWKLSKGTGSDFDFRRYNARDGIVLHLVKPALEAEAKTLGLGWLLDVLNGAVIPTARMAVNGIRFDAARRDEVLGKLSTHLAELKDEIETLGLSPGINLNSPKQVSEMLFKTLKLRSGVKTGSGEALSTNEDVLKKLTIRHPESRVPSLLLDYREAEKIRSTYIDPPIGLDGRVHSTFTLHGTVTGRFNSSDPNLQNLPNPARDKTGFIRTLYAAEPGCTIVESDHSQVELRIFATIAHDIPWLGAFERGDDIHALNMLDVYGEYIEKHRTFIKNFIYGIVYGSEGQEIERVCPLELMQRANIRQALVNLWAKHPALFAYKTGIEIEMREKQKITNPFGRIRWFTNKPTQANLREAVNFPIQSVVSDVMHYHFAQLDKELDRDKDKIILQLHDSFYIETPTSRAETVAKIVKEVMESPVTAPNGMVFQWPVEQKSGPNMGEMGKLNG